MNKGELKEKIALLDKQGVPDDMDIFMSQTDLSYEFSPLENIEVREISFRPDDGTEAAKENCIVLSD